MSEDLRARFPRLASCALLKRADRDPRAAIEAEGFLDRQLARVWLAGALGGDLAVHDNLQSFERATRPRMRTDAVLVRWVECDPVARPVAIDVELQQGAIRRETAPPL